MMQWAKIQRGFTIVELLIVIVVIAILAAISIVAYNGIQTRSRNTAAGSTIAAYVKALKLYEGENGVMPEDGATTDVYRCLGEAYPNGCGTVSGPTGCGLGVISNAVSLSFNAAIRTYMSNATQVPRINDNGLACSNGGMVAGALYIYRGSSSKKSEIYYMQEGAGSSCIVPGGATLAAQAPQNVATLCRLYLN